MRFEITRICSGHRHRKERASNNYFVFFLVCPFRGIDEPLTATQRVLNKTLMHIYRLYLNTVNGCWNKATRQGWPAHTLSHTQCTVVLQFMSLIRCDFGDRICQLSLFSCFHVREAWSNSFDMYVLCMRLLQTCVLSPTKGIRYPSAKRATVSQCSSQSMPVSHFCIPPCRLDVFGLEAWIGIECYKILLDSGLAAKPYDAISVAIVTLIQFFQALSFSVCITVTVFTIPSPSYFSRSVLFEYSSSS